MRGQTGWGRNPRAFHLLNRLARSGAAVVETVKPGFARTSTIAGMTLPKLIAASTERVLQPSLGLPPGGREVVRLLRIRRAAMGVIGALPEPVFKRLKV